MKERTLRGVHSGFQIVLGLEPGQATPAVATVWSEMLLLGRYKRQPLIRRWHGRYLAGGLFWVEVPHQFLRNPRNICLYPDTLLNALTWPIRPWLMPGLEPHRRLWRWLRGQ